MFSFFFGAHMWALIAAGGVLLCVSFYLLGIYQICLVALPVLFIQIFSAVSDHNLPDVLLVLVTHLSFFFSTSVFLQLSFNVWSIYRSSSLNERDGSRTSCSLSAQWSTTQNAHTNIQYMMWNWLSLILGLTRLRKVMTASHNWRSFEVFVSSDLTHVTKNPNQTFHELGLQFFFYKPFFSPTYLMLIYI